MKTNSSARGTRRARLILLSLTILALAVIEFRVGESLAARFGQMGSPPSDIAQLPNNGLADLMAAAR